MNFFRKYPPLVFVVLTISAIFGSWLVGMFESEPRTGDISAVELLLALLGFFLLVGSLLGLLLLFRQRVPPMSQAEISAWEIVREQGKRAYLRRALKKGFMLGLIGGAFVVSNDFRRDGLSGINLTGFAIPLLLTTFACYYAASRIWVANENALALRAKTDD